jgi:hypothetical protein
MFSTSYRTDRELLWIKELVTAMSYGCNDNIKGVGHLSSPGCNEINTIPRTNVASVIKEFNMLMLKSPLNQNVTRYL